MFFFIVEFHKKKTSGNSTSMSRNARCRTNLSTKAPVWISYHCQGPRNAIGQRLQTMSALSYLSDTCNWVVRLVHTPRPIETFRFRAWMRMIYETSSNILQWRCSMCYKTTKPTSGLTGKRDQEEHTQSAKSITTLESRKMHQNILSRWLFQQLPHSTRFLP